MVEPGDGEVAVTVLEALVREAVSMASGGRLPTGDELESHGRPGRALRAALDAARFDLEGTPSRRCGPTGDGVGVNATIPLLGPAASAEAARQSVDAGFATLKLKAGAERETEVARRPRARGAGGRSARTSTSAST